MRPLKKLTLAAATVVGCVVAMPGFAQVTDWRKINTPALSEFKIQEPKRIVLANGMVIFLQEDHELPLITGNIAIRGGSRDEPAEKVGLASIFGQAWRTGGTKARTGDAIDEYLELRAAKVETSADVDSSMVSMNSLKQDFDDVLGVAIELLREPEFREEKIVLAKNQLNTGISRRNDNPMQIAGREAMKIAYGPTSPYARVEEYYTVAAVKREDLLAWHRRFVHPNNMLVGIVGDFDSAKMEAKLRAAFEKLPKGPEAPKMTAEFPDPKPGVYFIAKDDVNQSSIRMVHMGVQRNNPDYYALEVMNEIFGGGFSARLFSNIRSKKGLAYNVGGGVGSSWDHPGVFQISMGTKSQSTSAAIDALREEIDQLHKSPPTADELKRARESILNSFVFRFDTKAKVIAERMNLEFYGYPADFTAKYRTAIEKVTTDDVARVANKYVTGDKVALLVVGKAGDFDKPLSSYGQVSNIDITIPDTAPGTVKPAAPTGSSTQGRQLLDKVVMQMGGAKVLSAAKSLRQNSVAVMKTPQGEMTVEIDSVSAFPDRMRQVMKTPMGEMTMVAAPGGAFMLGPMGTRDLPSSQKDQMLREMNWNPIAVAQHASDPKYTFNIVGEETIGGVKTQILEISADGNSTRWFVDPASGRVLRSSTRATGPTGPTEQVANFSDWKTMNGITLPMKRTIMQGGKEAGTAEIKTFEINPATDTKSWEKPPAK
ncbi:MAG TPA: pitrilysin family protein [Thermoanaerobaculia bacterium]|nr:pitrilysin family protein [Thermoanaerobaculia bacterium]